MRKQSAIKILSAFAVALMLSLTTIGQVFAATPFVNNVTTLPIKRTINNVSNNVTNTFTYTITQNANNPTGATGLPTSATIVFNNTVPTSNTVEESGTVDFSGATFTTAGDYEFTISETESTNPTNFPIDPTTYTIIAAVRYDSNHALEATLLQEVRNNGGTKTDATWEYNAQRTHFEITETTSGNMADVNKCFEYTLNIPAGNGVTAGDTFTASVTSSCTGNPSTITAGTPETIRLASGDTAVIGSSSGVAEQIPIGAGYTLTLVADDGYTATFNNESMTAGTAKTVTGLVGPLDTDFDTKNKANLALTKSSDIPTGIFTNVWTYVVILGISATGIAVVSKKYSKK